MEAKPAGANQASQPLHFRQVSLRCPAITPSNPDQDPSNALLHRRFQNKTISATHKQKRHPITDGVL